MTLSVAEEATAPSTGDNWACSDGRSGEDKRGHGNPSTEGRVSSEESICHGCRQEG